MDFPITGSVSETDPQVILRDRYSENGVVVLKKETSYGEAEVFEEITIRQVEYAILRRDRLDREVTRNNHAKDNVKSIIISALEDENIDDDLAKEIADALGIELSRSVEVSVTVDFSLTLNIPYGSDLDDVVGDLNFSVETGYTYDCELESEDFHISDWSEG
jgi:hypothetical protein